MTHTEPTHLIAPGVYDLDEAGNLVGVDDVAIAYLTNIGLQGTFPLFEREHCAKFAHTAHDPWQRIRDGRVY